MSYRPYPSKKPISYGSRHHMLQAYKAPSVRGYGSRSPFQTGSGTVTATVLSGTGTHVSTNPLGTSVGVNVGMGLTTSSNNIDTMSSKYFASIENDGHVSTTSSWGTIPIRLSTVGASAATGVSISANRLNVTAGGVYFVCLSVTNQISVNQTPAMGLRVLDGGANPFLVSTGQSSNQMNPYTYTVSGFVIPIVDGLSFEVFNSHATSSFDMTASVFRIK